MYLHSHEHLLPGAGPSPHVNGDGFIPRMSSHVEGSNGAFFPPAIMPSDQSAGYAYDERRLIGGLNELANAALERESIPILQPRPFRVTEQQMTYPSSGVPLAQTYPGNISSPELSLARETIEDSHLSAPNHPTTVSTSSEELSSKPHDVFSNYDTDDTVTDPDVEGPRRLEQHVRVPIVPNAISKPPATGESENKPPSTENGVVETIAPTALGGNTTSPPTESKAPFPRSPIEATHVEASLDDAVPDMDAPSIGQLIQQQCSSPECPPEVPSALLHILDNVVADGVLAKQYASHGSKLCHVHLQKFAEVMTRLAQASITTAPLHQTGIGTRWKPLSQSTRKRPTPPHSPAPVEDVSPFKKQKLGDINVPSVKIASVDVVSPRPSPDTAHDEAYRQQMLVELGQRFTQKSEDDISRGELTNRLIHEILTKIKQPNADPRNGPVDAGFMTGIEAAAALSKGILNFPIFTQGQQQFQWSNADRPISELFRRMEDLGRTVSVQIPSIHWDSPSAERRTLVDVQQRFLENKKSDDPWNILDLRSPLPPSVLPSFLTGENCQLLPRMRDALLMGDCAERTKAMRQEWNEWTELLEWVLLSEGGHNTAPHMDSHGWATWITVQEGLFGFGWMARPTEAEQNAWMADPIHYTGGNWRFLILKPGQTVFFPTGTIHFVFRLRSEQTLAVGGHVLQWSGIERWITIILNQLKNPSITNEDLGVDVLKYVRTVASLVTNRLKQCRLGELGTIDTAQRFLVLTNEVERHFQRKKKKKSKR